MFTRRFLSSNVPCFCRAVNYSSFQLKKPSNCNSFGNISQNKSLSGVILTNCYLPSNYSSKRLKTDKKKKKVDDNSDDENEDEFKSDDKSLSKDSKLLSIKLTSMRADAIYKAGLGVSRNKIETLFYESKLRINGKKLMKKSAQVFEGDELDIVKGLSPQNPNFLYVSRFEVMKAGVEDDQIVMTGRRFKSLLIENYEDPWKQETIKELS